MNPRSLMSYIRRCDPELRRVVLMRVKEKARNGNRCCQKVLADLAKVVEAKRHERAAAPVLAAVAGMDIADYPWNSPDFYVIEDADQMADELYRDLASAWYWGDGGSNMPMEVWDGTQIEIGRFGRRLKKFKKINKKLLNPKNHIKMLKKVTKPALKIASKAAKVVGPAVASIYPPAAPLVKASTKILNAAENGIPGALKQVTSIVKNAKAGSPVAQGMLDGLKLASNLKKHKKAMSLIMRAKNGDQDAAHQIAAISQAANQGDPEAAKAMGDLKAANKGRKMQSNIQRLKRIAKVRRAIKTKGTLSPLGIVSPYEAGTSLLKVGS